jgi:glycosyltransferase involved in cell wall biosynthesis
MKYTSNKIAFFLPSLRGGGAERVVLNLVNGIAEKGIPVDLVLVRKEGQYLSQVPFNARIIDLNARRVLTSIIGLAWYLRKEKPMSLLSVMDHCNIIAILANLISRANVKTVISIHNTFSEVMTNKHDNLWGRIIIGLVRLLYRFSDNIIVVSKGAADDLQNIKGIIKKNIKIIYNPAITSSIYQLAHEKEENLPNDKRKLVVAVGRLTQQKDFKTLIKAFKIVKNEYDARLMILGEGEERVELEKLVCELGMSGSVYLCGFKKNPYAIMAKASLFVLSSIYEGLPTVLIEAIALGVPIVSTDCKSGPKEILEIAGTGRLVKVGDISGLAEAMIKAIRYDSRYEINKDFIKVFSLDYATDEYLKVLL